MKRHCGYHENKNECPRVVKRLYTNKVMGLVIGLDTHIIPVGFELVRFEHWHPRPIPIRVRVRVRVRRFEV